MDATDSKGETIHQTLMAKKMQKLDDMGEYRPFKFRIQAFTNRFAEELVARGLTEAQVPHKLVGCALKSPKDQQCRAPLTRGPFVVVSQVRIFLWNQPLVSRYNEEGKKAKSKGNHVWSIDARSKWCPLYLQTAHHQGITHQVFLSFDLLQRSARANGTSDLFSGEL